MTRRNRLAILTGVTLIAAGAVAAWSKTPRTTTGGVNGTITIKQGGKPRADRSGVVIWLEGVKGTPAPGTDPAAQIKQINKQFAPQLTVVQKGSTVEFPNQDKVFHNVFSVSRAARFDLGLYKSGTSKTVQLKRTGVVDLYCNIHPEMVAKVVVVDGPYFAVTGKDGMFSMSGVPPGTYKLVAWQAEADEWRGDVTITANAEARVQIELVGKGKTTEPHLRKDGTPYGRYK